MADGGPHPTTLDPCESYEAADAVSLWEFCASLF